MQTGVIEPQSTVHYQAGQPLTNLGVEQVRTVEMRKSYWVTSRRDGS